MDYLLLNYISLGMGVLISLLGLPMFLRKVKPNGLYGFRTKKTLSSPDIWYPANRASGFSMILAGLFMIVVTLFIILFWKDASETAFALVHLALWIVSVTGMTVSSFLSLRRLG